MADYRLSLEAKEDLIRIHQYGVQTFGMEQADRYLKGLFDTFDRIAAQPYAFEKVNHIRDGYRRATSGVDSIYFRIQPGAVDIMAIIGRQNLDLR